LRIFFPSYIESAVPAQILSFGIVPMMIIWVINSKFITTGSTRPVLVGALIYQIIQIVLLVYLGNYIGLNGLALAVVLALSFQAIFLFLSKYLKEGNWSPLSYYTYNRVGALLDLQGDMSNTT
jgi:O-antigen/teichoic acid export membrane protein